MKRLLVIFFCIIATNSFSQTKVDVFSFEQAESIFKMLGSFNYLETKSNNLQSEVPSLIHNNFGKSNVFSYFIESFIRETESEEIRSITKKYISGLEKTDSISAVLMRYDSSIEIETNSKGKNETIRYNFQNMFFDEDIKFSRIKKAELFDNEIHIFLPLAEFVPLYYKPADSEQNDPNKLLLMAGGQTTAISINAERLVMRQNLKIDDYIRKDTNSEFTDISRIGVVAKNKFDQTFISETGNDNTFKLILYFANKEKRIFYKIRYNYYISPSNINYLLFEDLKKHLINISLLTYKN